MTASTTITQAFTLTSGQTLTLPGTVEVTVSSGPAVYAGSGTSGVAVNNAGTIITSEQLDPAIYFGDGGSVTNQATGTISGAGIDSSGLVIAHAPGTVVNYGAISGESDGLDYGVSLGKGGSVTNHAGGTISGGFGGVAVTGGCSVTNQADAVISGGYGVFIEGNATQTATLVNAGAITGTHGTAVAFGLVSPQANTFLPINADLIIDPGASFNGAVIATASYTNGSGSVSSFSNTLDLASTSTAGVVNTGTISGIGSEFQNFNTFVEDAGASWVLKGANTVSGGIILGANATLTVGANATLDATGFGAIDAGSTASGVVVSNAGTIDAISPVGAGVDLGAGGSVTNQAGGVISGSLGVFIAGNATQTATLINAGAITGTQGAVSFGDINADLIVDPGASFNGAVVATSNYNNTLDLASASSAGVVNTGTISGIGSEFGSEFQNFNIFAEDAGASWVLNGANTVSGQGIVLGANATLSVGANAKLDATGSDAIYASPTTSGVVVSNAGTIDASSGFGIALEDGGSVTNHAGGTISGIFGAYIGGNGSGTATLVNAGTITGLSDAAVVFGHVNADLILDPGGSFSGAVIATASYDSKSRSIISLSNTLDLASTSSAGVVNTGTIAGIGAEFQNFNTIVEDAGASWVLNGANTVSGQGIVLGANATLSVGANAKLDATGGDAIYASPTTSGGVVSNAGTISVSGGFGVDLTDGGSVTNHAGGTISGIFGAYIGGNGSGTATLVNAGTITGHVAVEFGNTNADLIVDPGASFSGAVIATTSYDSKTRSIISLSNTLDLASASSAGTLAGSIGGSAAQYQNFQTITLADNADWTLSGTVAVGETLILGNAGVIGLGDTATNPTDFAGTLENLVAGDTIVLTNDAYSSADQVSLGAGNVLSVTSGASTLADLQLAPNASYQASDFSLISAGGQEAITDTIPCFVRGTCIQTARGEVAVEKLRPGDRVAVLGGGFRPIIWIGRRRIAIAHHPRPEKVQPIRIKAGAIADGMPARDLRVSPGHGIYFQRVLIPAEHLLNGVSVVRERVATVEYFHVELDEHAVLFSEGYPSESYLDTGNRHNFAGAGMALHPDFSPRPPKTWRETCTPLVWDGREWLAARRQLRLRLAAFGAIESADPDLHLRLGARRIKAIATTRAGRLTTHRFAIPEGTRTGPLTLASAIAIPGDILPDCADHRPLGIALHRLVFRGRGGATEITLNTLARGWYDLEKSAKGACWRWSDGAGELPHLGPGLLECTTATGDLGYLIAPAPPAKQPRAAAMMRRASAQRAKQSNASNPAHTTSVTSEPGDRAFRA